MNNLLTNQFKPLLCPPKNAVTSVNWYLWCLLQDKSEEEEANQKEEVKIEWCEFVECGNKLLTLNEDSELQLLETSTLKQLGCVSKVLCATVTPDDSHIVACGNWDLKYLEIPTLETLATYDVGNIIQDETMDPIRGKISMNECSQGPHCILKNVVWIWTSQRTAVVSTIP